MLDVTAEEAMIQKTVNLHDDPIGFFYAPDLSDVELANFDIIDEDDQCSDPEIEKNIVQQLNIVDKEVYRANYKVMQTLDKMAEKYKNLQDEYRSQGSEAIKGFSKEATQIQDPTQRLQQMFEADNTVIKKQIVKKSEKKASKMEFDEDVERQFYIIFETINIKKVQLSKERMEIEKRNQVGKFEYKKKKGQAAVVNWDIVENIDEPKPENLDLDLFVEE